MVLDLLGHDFFTRGSLTRNLLERDLRPPSKRICSFMGAYRKAFIAQCASRRTVHLDNLEESQAQI